MKNYKEYLAYKYLKELGLRVIVKLAPEKEVDRCYYKSFGVHCNLKNPQNLIEKIFWMELHTDTSIWTLCSDKYRIREYVDKCGYIDYMPKLYGQWDNINDISFDELPKEFVLKANNGCGTVKVISDKGKIDATKVKKELKSWLRFKYGYSNAQLHYTKIKPCIIAEELLKNDFTEYSLNSIVDFKVWCINGEPLYVFVAYNRKGFEINMQLYDASWKPRPEYLTNRCNGDLYNPTDPLFPKPKCLEDMLEISRKLSEPFSEVRIDFYIVNDRPIIGEMTFSSGYGYFTDDFYLLLGKEIDLTKIRKIK